MFTSRLFGGPPPTLFPYSLPSPRVASSKPAIIRIVVVLPQPDGPRSEKNSPTPISRSTPATACTTSPWELNSLTIPTSSIAGSVSVDCPGLAHSRVCVIYRPPRPAEGPRFRLLIPHRLDVAKR